MLAPSQELWNDSSQLLYFFAENSRLLLTEMKYEKTFFTFFFDNSYNNSYNYHINIVSATTNPGLAAQSGRISTVWEGYDEVYKKSTCHQQSSPDPGGAAGSGIEHCVYWGGGLAFADDASLSGNTKTIGKATGERTYISNWIVGVKAPYDSPETIQMNDNKLTVQNVEAGDVTGISKEGNTFSLTAKNNHLNVTDSEVAEIREIEFTASNAQSKSIIADNEVIVTKTKVNDRYFGICQFDGSGDLIRNANTTRFENSSVEGCAIGNYGHCSRNNITSQGNVISLTGSTVGSNLIQDYVWAYNEGIFIGNQIILDDSTVNGPVWGEAFTGPDDAKATITAKNNSITLQNGSYAGSAVTVNVGNT